MGTRAAGEAPPATQQLLPPGFRFHPTDLELLLQYLRRMALDRPLPAAVIPVVHAAALPDPWDLPGASEGESAYFFSLRQAASSGRGGRRRRAASGYWKATGKEKPVFVQLPVGKRLLVGVKTALAFQRGKSRTDWVMHEYRLAGAAEQNKRANDDSPQSSEWVVCRVSLKSRARRAAAGRETTADHHQQPSPSSTSSCVTDHACHAPDQEEVSSQQQQEQQHPRR
ncbi:hypothetical protein ZWY2020_036218 [Hordeum vulgare]|nr:hypothetical protein ZWY2020_036218 [Hordeum vulgare]